MTAYKTIVVGTDGSDSSYKAVEKAAALAGAAAATLIIACAYYPTDERGLGATTDVLKDDAYLPGARFPANGRRDPAHGA